MDIIFSGKKLDKKEVRAYDPKLSDYNMACSLAEAEYETETSNYKYPTKLVETAELNIIDTEVELRNKFTDIIKMAEEIKASESK